MRWCAVWLSAVSALCVVGCGSESPASENAASKGRSQSADRLVIVATTGMVADVVRQVAGTHGEVTNLMGEGVDPHLYKPTRSDIAQIMEADVVLYSGLLLEGRMTDVFVKAARSGQQVHAVTEMIDPEFLLEPAEMEGHYDPHLWMDVSAWSKCTNAVATVLAQIEPEHADEFRANAQQFQSELTRLDEYARRSIESIPENQRVLLTAHDAFGYFGRAYGIEVLGIQGISTESEAGLNDINRLIDFLVERNVPAVFVESSVSDRNVKALLEGAASRGHAVRIGGELFSDAMGPTDTYEGTYIGMIDHNVTTITRALGGDAPERGLNGRLATKANSDDR